MLRSKSSLVTEENCLAGSAETVRGVSMEDSEQFETSRVSPANESRLGNAHILVMIPSKVK
uniref:Uncharacterized protein n=1 Tax=Octopus bimaculoides TaxID=37653 RepID=A0A0L8H297_OCTBM